MSKFHGAKGVFKIDNSSGSLTDISAHITDISFPRTMASIDVTGEGQSGTPVKSTIPSFVESKFSIKGNYDNTATTGSETVLGTLANNGGQLAAGGSLSFEYDPAGTAAGTTKYSGECFMTSYVTTSPVAGAVNFTAEFEVTGAITPGTN